MSSTLKYVIKKNHPQRYLSTKNIISHVVMLKQNTLSEKKVNMLVFKAIKVKYKASFWRF